MLSGRTKKMLIIPAVVLGVLVFLLIINLKKTPKQVEISERPRAVRFIPASEISITTRAMGYGTVQSNQTWEAVAEVSGKVLEIHPKLKKGAIIKEGEALLRIDPAEYGLAKIRAQADLENLRVQLNELDQKEKDIKYSLEVENLSLSLGQKELGRKNKLFSNRYISKSELEKEEKQVLMQKNAVQNIKSALNLIPTQRKALLAKITSSETKLTDTDLDIEKTTISAPYNCRVTEVNVEMAQFVSIGKVLFKADNMGSVDILAQIPVYTLMNLLGGDAGRTVKYGTMITKTKPDMGEMRDFSGFSAFIRIYFGDNKIEWKGRFTRVSDTLDRQTRTIGVYVTVDNPYKKIRPGEKPPLIKNMYCEVELRGKPRDKAVIIPRSALHQGAVYIANSSNRLEIRKIETGYAQGSLVSVKKGLAVGEQIIVTDVIPAIEGMLLELQPDQELLTSIIAEASGEAPLK